MENNPIRFRNLRKEEIECRIGSLFTRNGQVWGEILLYQDARAAQRILDEVFGYNWQNTYKEVNGETVCTISVWNEVRGQWVTRENVGSETTIEAAKGCFSDAFKRAASTLGIGRSLYSAPTVEVPLKEDTEYYFDKATGKPKRSYHFSMRVAQIDYDKETDDITRLILVDDNSIRYDWSRPASLSADDIKKMKEGTQTAPAAAAQPAQQAPATPVAEDGPAAEKPQETVPATEAEKTMKKPVTKKAAAPKSEEKPQEKPVEKPQVAAQAQPAVLPAQNPEGKPVLSPKNEKWGKGVVQIAKMPQTMSLTDIYLKVTGKFFITDEDFKTLLCNAGRLDENINKDEYARLITTIKAAAKAA